MMIMNRIHKKPSTFSQHRYNNLKYINNTHVADPFSLVQMHDSQLHIGEGVNTHSLQDITEKVYCEGSILKGRRNSKHKNQYDNSLHIFTNMTNAFLGIYIWKVHFCSVLCSNFDCEIMFFFSSVIQYSLVYSILFLNWLHLNRKLGDSLKYMDSAFFHQYDYLK